MVENRSVSVACIITTALWVAAFGLVVAVWAAVAAGNHGAAQALGFTACAMTGVAATASVRRYTVRLMALIRATHGLGSDDARPDGGRTELHAVSESTL